MSATPWIVVVQTRRGYTHLCERCGEELDMPLPMLVDEWCRAAEAFVQKHSACEPAPVRS